MVNFSPFLSCPLSPRTVAWSLLPAESGAWSVILSQSIPEHFLHQTSWCNPNMCQESDSSVYHHILVLACLVCCHGHSWTVFPSISIWETGSRHNLSSSHRWSSRRKAVWQFWCSQNEYILNILKLSISSSGLHLYFHRTSSFKLAYVLLAEEAQLACICLENTICFSLFISRSSNYSHVWFTQSEILAPETSFWSAWSIWCQHRWMCLRGQILLISGNKIIKLFLS